MKHGYWVITLIAAISILGLGCGRKSDESLPVPELERLDALMSDSPLFSARADSAANAMKRKLYQSVSDSAKWALLCQLADHYRPRQADSSIHYSNEAFELANRSLGESQRIKGELLIVEAMSASGFFSGALLRYDSIGASRIPASIKIDYWYSGRRLYSNICNYIGVESAIYDTYQAKYIECDDSLIANLPADSDERSFLVNERLVARGKVNSARKGLEALMTKLDEEDNLYGMSAYQLAQVYRNEDPRKYAGYLAAASASDIMGAVRDGFALPALSVWLFEQRNFYPAFQYVNFALEEADKANARMRMVKISQWMPRIDEAYRDELSRSRNEFAMFSIMVSVLFLLLIGLLVYLLVEMRHRRRIHTVMSSTSKLKDAYIRDFINLCSVYSEKYDNLCQTVSRKVSAGQAQDLLKIVKYGKQSDQDNEEFYRTIDSVFLQLYPDFIEKINSLLAEGDRFDVDPASGRLTPELRIYGFVRLGVTESSKIARILSYSVNTVYAYRNRMRNRALDRDGFDEAVSMFDMEKP